MGKLIDLRDVFTEIYESNRENALKKNFLNTEDSKRTMEQLYNLIFNESAESISKTGCEAKN